MRKATRDAKKKKVEHENVRRGDRNTVRTAIFLTEIISIGQAINGAMILPLSSLKFC